MLLPQEIRNHEFTRAIRGYTTTEVDEYIDFLAEKFDSLNRENDELERKLAIAIKKLEELQAREIRITRLDTEMRRAAAKLLHEAEMQQAKIIGEAQAKAAQITAEADAKAARQENLCAVMQEEILRFKEDLYTRYGQHIDALEEIAQASAQLAFDPPVPAAAAMPSAPAPAEEAPEEIEETPAVEEPPIVENTPAIEEVPELEETPVIEEVSMSEETPVIEKTPVIEEAPEKNEAEENAVSEEFEEIPEIVEIPKIGEAAEAEESAPTEEVEQIDLFDTVNDMDDIHREIAGIIGEDTLWTDAIHIINDEEMDPGYTLILPESAEAEEESEAEEDISDMEEESAQMEEESDSEETEDEDALLLQSLRRAFSVEFDTFDPKKSSSETSSAKDDTSEFDFVENEAPKKRGFLSRLIGGDD